MQPTTEEVRLTILLGTVLVLFFAIIIVFLIIIFKKKNQLHLNEKAMIQQQSAQQLQQTQLEVEEQTRLHIAEDLHDNIGALSSLIKINLNLLSTEQEANKKSTLLSETKALVKTLIADVKQMSISLHSNRIANVGIVEAIHMEVERYEKLGLFSVQFTVTGEEITLNSDRHLILFRICQELLHNIVKHASASVVSIDIRFVPTQLQITIQDDGKGFDVEAAQQKKSGSGLINLYNRAKLIGGSLYLNSKEANGTFCIIQIPL